MAQLSDGTLRMLGMLTAFYQPRAPQRITLEEPEQMIHPGLLPVLLDASRDYLDGGRTPRQTLFTTHSPTLLDQFEPTSIIATKFEKGVSKFAKISSRQVDVIKRRLFSAGELLVTEGIIP
jgi:predicted ATPase